jgi:hypothetical protein
MATAKLKASLKLKKIAMQSYLVNSLGRCVVQQKCRSNPRSAEILNCIDRMGGGGNVNS